MSLYGFCPSLPVSVKVTSFQALGHQPSDCFQSIAWESKRFLPNDCPFIQAIASNRLPVYPSDCPFIQAIASCLRPSDFFSIQSIALCRLRILEFHIIDCFTVHFIALLMMLSAIRSACNTRVNKGLRMIE